RARISAEYFGWTFFFTLPSVCNFSMTSFSQRVRSPKNPGRFITLIMFLDEAEHGVRVPALGSDGKPLLRISHAAQSFGDFGNGRWICIDIVTWLLEKGRVAKPLRQVEERMLIAESTSLAKMAGVLFRLSESSRMGVCPLLFHACQHTTLLCLGMPVGTPGILVDVFIVGGMDQCQGVVSEGVALAGRRFQPIQQERCEITLVII
ncbi:hypothetical protein, partial [Burkholderia gladioli]|uniref:hypothetical protein n=1 Tax=Burkholderia gladioli TaxID=28095 RepID=UPI001640B2BD